MPAIDSCEQNVVNALLKEGWEVVNRPYPIPWSPDLKYVFADFRIQSIEQPSRQLIVVEVKCFPNNRQMLAEFYGAIGQYLFYQTALEILQLDEPLFLAIPEVIYSGLFQFPIIQSIIRKVGVKLIVVNVDTEEVIRWLD
jgi:XisH protein